LGITGAWLKGSAFADNGPQTLDVYQGCQLVPVSKGAGGNQYRISEFEAATPGYVNSEVR